MKISSPFPSALTAVSRQAYLIDRFPAGQVYVNPCPQLPMYPCRCTDLEALQLLQLASWNCELREDDF